MRHPFGDVDVDFIGREAFIRNKRATGRAKDLGDIEGMSSTLIHAWSGLVNSSVSGMTSVPTM